MRIDRQVLKMIGKVVNKVEKFKCTEKYSSLRKI